MLSSQNPDMAKHPRKQKATSFLSVTVKIIGGAFCALVLIWSFGSIISPDNSNSISNLSSSLFNKESNTTTPPKPEFSSFYDDPEVSYLMEKPMHEWDEKRSKWLAQHPSFSGGNRVLMLTGSQPTPCKNPIGDHLLLRLFKNKVDYCRIHGCEVFYNNVLLHQKMFSYWAKYPLIKAAMIAHPEAEWIWWVDSDAIITDMDFDLPLEKYADYNLVFNGWPDVIFEKRSWVGLNAGVFLIRNCQWSMDFLDRWASFGPQTKDYEKWGKVLKSEFPDKLFPESDDQTALAYLTVIEKEKWGNKIHIEDEYYFQGWWMDIMGKLDKVAKHYSQAEKSEINLRSRQAEKAGDEYRAKWQQYLNGVDTGGFTGEGSWRRPFVTHFTGCQPCSGTFNHLYSAESCFGGMVKAMNFADNQVLRNWGYTRLDISKTSSVKPLKF